MHSFHWGANEKKWAHFHHNGDYSGDIVIVMPDRVGKVELQPADEFGDPTIAVRIPFKAMKAFVMSYLKSVATSHFEDMSDKDIEKWAIDIMKAEMRNENRS